MKIGVVYNTVLTVIFLLIIFAVMTLFFTLKKNDVNEVENRQLAVLPTLSINRLDPFPSQFDQYFSDHFPFRSQIVKAYNKINISLFKISPLPFKVIIGNNDFLFMADKQIETYQGKNLFSEEELASILEELVYRRDFCSQHGAKFYFAILPQKHTTYEENIPLRYKLLNKTTLRKQLESYLLEHHFSVIDPTNYIIEKKTSDFPLYYKTDNHWNHLGAFYGAQVIVDRIKEDFPQVKSLNISDYSVSKEIRIGGNLAQMLSMQIELPDEKMILEPNFISTVTTGTKAPYTPVSDFAYTDEFEIVYTNPDVNNLKALFLRESFATGQQQFYKQSFGKTVLIWDAWQYGLNKDIIINEKPDIVVIQVMEGFLRKLLIHQDKKSDLNK